MNCRTKKKHAVCDAVHWTVKNLHRQSFKCFSDLGDDDFPRLSQAVAAVDALLLCSGIPSLKQRVETEDTCFICRKGSKFYCSQNLQDP